MSSNDRARGSEAEVAFTDAEAAILQLAREHLGLDNSVFYAPAIPPAKHDNARRVHAESLAEGEQILVLHDDTVFGSAEDGFVITAARLCWKNLVEDPRQIPWAALDPTQLAAVPGAVHLASGKIDILGDLSTRATALFQALAVRARAPDRGPYRALVQIAETPEPVSLPEALILELARTHLGEARDVFYWPEIPVAKERRARAAHAAHLPEDEPVVVLYDDTVFGSAEEGILLTPARVCWKNITESARDLGWALLDPAAVHAGDNVVKIQGAVIQLTGRADLVDPVEALLRALGEEAMRRREAR